MKSPRSHLYVPGDDLERLTKSLHRGADALIIDLEDAIALDKKANTRLTVEGWLQTLNTTTEIWVRINNEPSLRDLDLKAVVYPVVTGVVFAKTTSSRDIEWLSQELSKLETARNISKPIEVCALIESAEGIFNAAAIAAGPRVSRLQVGESDLRADLGTSGEGADVTMQYARSVAVFASSAAKINPPIAAVSTNFKDLIAFKASTQAFKDWGYFGRACIHPAQLEIVNEVFTPSVGEISAAKDIIDRLQAAGGGVAVDSQGRMIDEAIAKIARRTLNIGQ